NSFSVEPLMLQFYHRDLVDSAGTFYNLLGWAQARGKDKNYKKYLKARETFSTCGGASIYRREIFDIIGYFDENHFAYLEDVDIGYRARIYGYKNYYEPKARVYHVGSGATGSRHNSFKVRVSARNNIWLIYKNMPIFQMVINIPFLLLGIAIKGLFFAKKGLIKDYSQGIYLGLIGLKKIKKVEYKNNNLFNYLKIELALLRNLLLIVLQ
ncbi:MAG TPA: glycosyltransferase family 2 protein, partial [Candidatus Dorea intestinavium]|nr:glycosyltransferase family 2 protein [Candidatus Dorea intestinavium]